MTLSQPEMPKDSPTADQMWGVVAAVTVQLLRHAIEDQKLEDSRVLELVQEFGRELRRGRMRQAGGREFVEQALIRASTKVGKVDDTPAGGNKCRVVHGGLR